MSEIPHKLSRIVGVAGPQPLDAKVATPEGWKTIGDLNVGSKVIAGDGKITDVLGITDFESRQIYSITLDDGTELKATADHTWPVMKIVREYINGRDIPHREFGFRTTCDLRPGGFKRQSNKRIDVMIPVIPDYHEQDFPVHPYVLGAILGNGYFGDNCPSIQLTDKKGFIAEAVRNFGYDVWKTKQPMQWRVDVGKQFKHHFKNHRAKNKYVPSQYFIGSIEQRKLLLAGLMDTDGTDGSRKTKFSSTSIDLCNAVIGLVNSLGGKAKFSSYVDRRKNNDTYKINVCTDFNPFMFQISKIENWKPERTSRYVWSIQPLSIEPARCIRIANETHLYATNGYIATHNSGKTNYLLSLIEAAAKKYDPEKIGAVSYTVAATEEMKARVAQTVNIHPDAAKQIRTIHSHCFRLMGYNKGQVADGAAKIKEWNEANPDLMLPVDLKLENITDPGALESNSDETAQGDIMIMKENLSLFRKMQYFRNVMRPKDEWPLDVAEFHTMWMRWLNMNDYVDFTSMLEQALENVACPDIDVLFVDEAQDTNVLQMRLLEKWIETVTSAVFVGDSAQCIFKFSGAVPENFINLPATWKKVLDKSWRVPKKPTELANAILRQHCMDAEDTFMVERDGNEGEVIWHSTEPDLSLPGTHMLLCRCNYLLVPWRDWLIKQGIPWHNPYRPEDNFMNPTSSKLWRAVRTYAKLREGDVVKMDELLRMVECVKAEGNLLRGTKRKAKGDEQEGNFNWMETVDFRNVGKMGLFTDDVCTLRKPIAEVFHLKGKVGDLIMHIGDTNQIFLKKPHTILSTVHGCKGGESDNVWIDTRTSPKGYRMWQLSQEARNDEARVAYVAVTRARERVGLIDGWKKGEGYPNQAFKVVMS